MRAPIHEAEVQGAVVEALHGAPLSPGRRRIVEAQPEMIRTGGRAVRAPWRLRDRLPVTTSWSAAHRSAGAVLRVRRIPRIVTRTVQSWVGGKAGELVGLGDGERRRWVVEAFASASAREVRVEAQGVGGWRAASAAGGRCTSPRSHAGRRGRARRVAAALEASALLKGDLAGGGADGAGGEGAGHGTRRRPQTTAIPRRSAVKIRTPPAPTDPPAIVSPPPAARRRTAGRRVCET
jgi:hypothetical protein